MLVNKKKHCRLGKLLLTDSEPRFVGILCGYLSCLCQPRCQRVQVGLFVHSILNIYRLSLIHGHWSHEDDFFPEKPICLGGDMPYSVEYPCTLHQVYPSAILQISLICRWYKPP